MTDRLKLSDPTGDAEVDKVAVAAEQEDRIQQLRKNIAALQAQLAKQTVSAAPSPAPAANNKIGARKHGNFKAISTAPSINWTPHGPTMVPVPYPVVQDLSSSVNTASTVRFNGCPVYLLDASTQPKCTGDERGTGKGIKSGTVSGEVKPVQGSSTVRVEGKRVVREGDACTMNGGNCPGIYVTTPPVSGAAPKEALATSNPQHTNRSGSASVATPQNVADPLGLFTKQTPAERLAAEITRNTLSGSNVVERMKAVGRSAASGPQLVPWDPNQSEAQRTRTTNSLNIALLGPFGAPGAATRLVGGTEQRVADANDAGAAAMSVAWSLTGMPSRHAISVAPRTVLQTNLYRSVGASRSLVTPTVLSASDGIKVVSGGAIDVAKAKDVYHATSGAKQADSILKGIDPKYLNPNSRFGKAFYVAEEPETALAEMAHYGIDPTTGIRFSMDSGAMKVLDLTNPKIAAKYGYKGGPISSDTQAIGVKARAEGFNVIRFNSERAMGGVNNAVLESYNEILKPQIVTQIKK
ncbi:DUF4150 domain-containing protein [Duganella sp. FT3S]|uniref:DUF4150 domain-containing protein n=1 Tax=Rugamonas fusca TaxID=2758568 RepID=A0A7W2EK53_9BURK|nr:PAAR-like domain-containing protein [Rugamonas fusca]MBA5607396.1 DUF4150 domain-containing protein [Rugamonas fusca]